ncbi:MAG: DUF3857 domain-containing protein [Victivallaceae bacterium]|nr:DUF3857 domain-containing protein [Victivallaceae bacterium]
MKSFFHNTLVWSLFLLAVTQLRLTAAPAPFINRAEAMQAAAKVDRKTYPDADQVLVRDVQKITYQSDGTAVEFDEFYQKILTEKGKRGASVFSEFFDRSYGTVKVWAIEIIKPSGAGVKIDVAANSKIMIYSGQMGGNIYDPNLKTLTVAVPGVEIGDTVRYFVQRTLPVPRIKNIWTDMYVVQSTAPVVDYTIEINAPSGRPLKKYLVKDAVKDSWTFAKKEAGDRIIYNWTFRNLPRMFPEPRMPAHHRHAERLLVSTAESWAEISQWYAKLCTPHLLKIIPEMEAKVAELTKNLTTDRQKIEAIFRFVSTQVRYLGLTLETTAPGYEPHDIDITFKNRYGVCRDKAALLAGMLRLAGIKAYPVLIMAGSKKDEEVPDNRFNHAITLAVTKTGETILMDSTNESTRELLPAYLSGKSYLPAKPAGSPLLTSPIIPASTNLLRAETAGELREDGSLQATTSLKFSGINDTIYRNVFSRWKPERIKQFFAARLKSIMPGAKLTGFKITPENPRNFKIPLSLELNFITDSLFIRGKNAMLLQLPWIGASFSAVNWLLGDLGLQKRLYPLQLMSTCGVSENFCCKIPPGLAIVKLPEYEKISWDKLSWKREITCRDKRLAGSSEYLINAIEFTPAEYAELKRDIKKIEFQNRKLIVLRKDFAGVKELPDLFPTAPAVIVNQESRIDVENPYRFTVSSRIKKKILNYAGVKDNSEIKIHYNPSWQKVTVKTVAITNPDGRKLKPNPSETNIMDQDWVSSAPRYPAGKVMVISLPGVQVGSLIEYELAIESAGQPFVNSMVLFRNSDPIISKETVLCCPERLKLKISPPPDCLNVSTTRKDGKIIHTWQSANLTAIPPEINTPPAWLFAPLVNFSGGDWPAYSRELKTHLEKAAAKQPAVEAVAAKLTAGKPPLEAMKAIRDYVAREIRAAGPGLSALPLTCISPADRTLRDAYGNSADRAVLLDAMLKQAGFTPEFIAVAGIPPVARARAELEAYPANDFNAVLVRVVHQGKSYYFNDTDQYAPLGSCAAEGRVGLELNTAKLEIIRPQPDLVSRLELDYSLKLIDDGSTLISSTTFSYGSDFGRENRLFSELSPEERRRHFQQAVARLAQSAVPITPFTTEFTAYPGKVHYAVKIPDYVVKDGKYLYFTLPDNCLDDLIRTGAEKRENPYFQSRYQRLRVKYSVELPGNCKQVVLQPEDRLFKYPQDGGSIRITARQSAPRRLEITYNIDLKPRIVPAEEYGFLVNMQTALSQPALRTIMLVIE